MDVSTPPSRLPGHPNHPHRLGHDRALVFALYPTAPPRMAHLGIGDSLALSQHTSHSPVLSALYNPYAAMPSLHMAFAVIAGGSLARYASHRWAKIAGLVYPLFVAAEVVATGNHYVLDLAAGAATVVISALATRRVLRPSAPILTAPPATSLQLSTACIGEGAQQAELRRRGSTPRHGGTRPRRRDGARRLVADSWLLIQTATQRTPADPRSAWRHASSSRRE